LSCSLIRIFCRLEQLEPRSRRTDDLDCGRLQISVRLNYWQKHSIGRSCLEGDAGVADDLAHRGCVPGMAMLEQAGVLYTERVAAKK
jgi:hypothetical protein